MMTEEEYLATHLQGLDVEKRCWYIHAMKTWTNEDYDQYEKFNLWMLEGEAEN